jgi:hypothetical protein
MESETDQPTTLRENRAMMAANYIQPSLVDRYVMSVTQRSSGRFAEKSRARMLGAGVWLGSAFVVTTNLRVGLENRPCRTMDASTRRLLISS